ncbi:hypothetical protein [Noviherbaspirillum sp. Root189]|uniref:hypothetical protein n=1 Tax=Noviherbaspirillum sp. Root189 TaxID=1736487 RepID=UPI0019103BA4|nr:hypothetical protein [Noviherbaspirillum sp. Root189]
MKKSLALLIVLACGASAVQAKLPPPTPEAKAAADAAKDKTAWSDKVASYKLCLVQDKVATQYLKSKEGAKKPTVETPPCTDPGPYVPTTAGAAPAPAPGSAAGGTTAAAAAPAGKPASPQASVAPANANANSNANAAAAANANSSATPAEPAKK